MLVGTHFWDAMPGLSRYQEQLCDRRWRERRLGILKRDGYACVSCHNADSALHVHHKRYAPGRDAWDYPDSELETLCEVCHAQIHKLRSHYQALTLSERDRFYKALFGPSFVHRREHLGFQFFQSPKNEASCLIVHIATGQWREFSLPLGVAHKRLVDNPATVKELKELIIYAAENDSCQSILTTQT